MLQQQRQLLQPSAHCASQIGSKSAPTYLVRGSRACSTARRGRRVPAVLVAASPDADKLPKWDKCYKYLVEERRLQSIVAAQARALQESGSHVLVDVRPPPAYNQAHPAGAVNVPMYQPLDWTAPTLGKVLKFIVYSSNGVSPVEPNPRFYEQMKEACAGGKGLIMLCEAGGTLKPSVNFPFGKASRSLQAAYKVLSQGACDDVKHLDRGVYGWYQADMDFEGESEYKPEIGRTPMAASEPTLNAIREGSNYDQRDSDRK